MTKTIKAVVVGRHSGEIPGVEVVGTVNITFANSVSEVKVQVERLINEAKAKDANALIFQNAPAILAATLVNWVRVEGEYALLNEGVKIGFIIGKQPTDPDVPRPAKQSMDRVVTANVTNVVDLLRFANGRATVDVWTDAGIDTTHVRVTVDPVPPFVFDHIEWL